METSPFMVSIVSATPTEFMARIDELVDVHLAAMNYPAHTHTSRRNLWMANAHRDGFTCSIALLHPAGTPASLGDPRQRALGVAYSFTGSAHTWWHSQVARGLLNHQCQPRSTDKQLHNNPQHVPQPQADILDNYSELSEIHVRPTAQQHGLGRALAIDVIARSSKDTIVLSTPEVPDENNAAWRLYRSLGFTDVLRNFYFGSDPRPFGVLCHRRPASDTR